MKAIKEFFNLNLSDKVGFQLPIGAILTILTFAFVLASFYLYFYKLASTTLYKRLLRYDATSEDKARSFAELKLDKARLIIFALKRGGEITKIVRTAGEERLTFDEYLKKTKTKGYKEEKKDYKTARFYIDVDKTDRAKALLAENVSILKPVIISVILVAVLITLVFTLPSLISLLD